MTFRKLGDWKREENRNLFGTESDPKEERKARLKKSKKKTADLTKAVITDLNLSGFVAWRNNNIPSQVRREIQKADGTTELKIQMKKNNTYNGTLDIIGFRKSDGKHLEIEIKVGKDSLSDDQEEQLDKLKKAGCISFVVKTLDDYFLQIKRFKTL